VNIVLKRCLVAACVLIINMAANVGLADSYEVTFSTARGDDDGALRQADVIARLKPDRGFIRLSRAGDDTGLYNGWATFVLSLEAMDSKGNSLALEYQPFGTWKLREWRGGEVTVKYSMLLQHDRFPNEPGDDELAVAKPYGVMWTGRALFLEGAPQKSIRVHFDAPAQWRITSPWTQFDGATSSFIAKDTNELLDSAFFAGVHDSTQTKIGGVEVRIATGPDMADESLLYKNILKTFLPEYVALFQTSDVPAPVIIGLPGSFWGGGVIGRTINLTHGGPLSAEIAPMVTHIVAHEAFHLWNSQWNFDPNARADIEWLVEGGAEYYTWLTAVRTRRFAPEAFFGEISDRRASYESALSEMTIAQAGKTKLENEQSYNLVYSGGMMMSLALDLLIRRETRGKYSLDDVMKVVHSEYTGDNGKELTERKFVGAIRKATGLRIGSFLNRYAHGSEALPLEDLLRDVGICFSNDRDNAVHAAACDFSSADELTARAHWLRLPQK